MYVLGITFIHTIFKQGCSSDSPTFYVATPLVLTVFLKIITSSSGRAFFIIITLCDYLYLPS